MKEKIISSLIIAIAIIFSGFLISTAIMDTGKAIVPALDDIAVSITFK